MGALEWFLLDILERVYVIGCSLCCLKPKDWDKDKENQFIKKIGIILLFANEKGIILVFSDIPSDILEILIDWIFGSSF